MSEFAYKSLLSPQNTSSGVADFALIAPVRDFKENGIKCPVAPFTDPGSSTTIKSAHEFLDGKAFAKYFLAPEQNELNGKAAGDKGFQKFNNELKIFLQGSYAELHETVKNMINTPHIALIKDSNCEAKMWYQMGCDCEFAWVSPEFSTGTTKDGKKGYILTLTYNSNCILMYDETAAGAPAVLAASGQSS